MPPDVLSQLQRELSSDQDSLSPESMSIAVSQLTNHRKQKIQNFNVSLLIAIV